MVVLLFKESHVGEKKQNESNTNKLGYTHPEIALFTPCLFARGADGGDN